MTSATAPPMPLSPPASPTERLLTVADLAAMPTSLPTGDVEYELNDGRLVIMPPPGDIHGEAAVRIGSFLFTGAELKGHGVARGEVGVILRRNPDRVVVPDACFIGNASLPVRRSPEGYLETIPDVVVEVRSKNDSLPAIESKAAEYLAAGVKLVWVIDPIRKLAAVYEPSKSPVTLGPDDELTAEPIVPAFRLKVGDILGR